MTDYLELDEFFAGEHINSVCEKAVALASSRAKPVHFKFNDIDVTVQPGELPADVVARWAADMTARWDHDREAAKKGLRA